MRKLIASYVARFKRAITHPREWMTWPNFLKVLTWVMVRVYALLLILFMLAIWQLNGMKHFDYWSFI